MEPLSLGMLLSFSEVPSAVGGFSFGETTPLANLDRSQSQSFASESVCRKQIEQLIGYLPLVGAWIVSSEFEDGLHRRWVGEAKGDRPEFNEAALSYLKSEVWFPSDLPVARISQFDNYYIYPLPPLTDGGFTQNFPQRDSDSGGVPNSRETERVSRCDRQWLGNESRDPQQHSDVTPSPTYLILWAAESLSPLHREFVKQQMQLLQYYLRSALAFNRQSQELHLLQQSLHHAKHQLRNSLSLIGLYAETLCLGLPNGPFQEQATVIRESVSELGNNLSTLLDCGKLDRKCLLQYHDLGKIVQETLKFLQPRLQEKNIRVESSQTSVMLPLDPWQIKQVFENLLNNAIAFSPPGSIITCEWRVFYNEVLVSLSDQGPGLGIEDLTQAFTPFYTRRPGGTGLGLPIAKKIILDHHGSIWVQNLPEGGALFSFTLPRHPHPHGE